LEIAERLGISRRTIYRWIQSGQLDRDLEEPSRFEGAAPDRGEVRNVSEP
jgi:transposase